EMAVTPPREPPFGRFGLETTLQLVPSQCSINGSSLGGSFFLEPGPVWYPTAHTSLLATAATPPKEAGCMTGGGGRALQRHPSKCTASGCSLLVSGFELPTAQISLSAIAAVLAKSALLNCATTLNVVDVAGVTAAVATGPAAAGSVTR